jgi:hypothetical protein
MRQLIQGTNVIVVVGAWNIAVFTPDWVKKYLLPDENFKIFFPSVVGCSLKFQTELFAFCIEGNRLQFEVAKPEASGEACIAIVKLVRTILRLLSHTPVNAMGVNFVFESESQFEVLNTLTDKEPLENIISLVGGGVKAQGLVRKFDIGSGKELTLRLDSTTGGKNRIDFNFNYNVTCAADVTNVLGDDDQLLITNQELARKIVAEVYGG